ncbi:MAG: hypothetical protein V1892_03705 [bacterium]
MRRGVLWSLFFLFLILFLINPILALAQDNSVTFDNQSGEDALVKLISSAGEAQKITVPNGSKETIYNLGNDTYHVKVRYGTPGHCRYIKGEYFELKAFDPYYAVANITLHPIVGGNYDTQSISEAEFNR